jgi:subtilisin
VAVLDTGIDIDHPDLDDNLAGCENFIYWWRNCNDDNGHGTHVTGIIAAEDNGFGVVGVAPKARIYSLKVLNSRGSGYLSDVLEALDWVIANEMDVVNMSLGTNSNITSFHEAVQEVYQAGIVLVAAGGNDGPGINTVDYPAAYLEVIAVSAIDAANNVPSWSSRGPEIDLTAPGINIYSTYRGGGYRTMQGTSMSTPHVTGVVALRQEDHPSENPNTIEAILEANADFLPFSPTLVGAGLVNAHKVVTAP